MIPQRIVVIGSSSVFGRVDPKGGGFIGRLKTWHESKARSHAVFNLGIGGETSEKMVKRLCVEAPPRKADLILVQTGLNDTRRIGGKNMPGITSLARFKENVEALISIGTSLAEVVFIGVYPIEDERTTPVKGTNYYYLNDDTKAYERVTKNCCTSKKIPYLDIFNDWLSIDYSPYIYEDGLHANSKGHQRIYSVLRDFLFELYR